MKYFYSEIIEIDTLIVELDQMELSPNHKSQLSRLIDAHIHQAVLDTILSKLSQADKVEFLTRLQSDPEDLRLLEFLNEKATGIEAEIKQVIKELTAELHKDIKDAKRLQPKKQK